MACGGPPLVAALASRARPGVPRPRARAPALPIRPGARHRHEPGAVLPGHAARTSEGRSALRHFEALGRSAIELGILWFASERRVLDMVSVKGLEHWERIKGRPIILLAPHFIGLNMGGARLGHEAPGLGQHLQPPEEPGARPAVPQGAAALRQPPAAVAAGRHARHREGPSRGAHALFPARHGLRPARRDLRAVLRRAGGHRDGAAAPGEAGPRHGAARRLLAARARLRGRDLPAVGGLSRPTTSRPTCAA